MYIVHEALRWAEHYANIGPRVQALQGWWLVIFGMISQRLTPHRQNLRRCQFCQKQGANITRHFKSKGQGNPERVVILVQGGGGRGGGGVKLGLDTFPPLLPLQSLKSNP